jgi:arsenate reductase
MDKIIIYEKPTCTTCRKMNKLLEEMKIDYAKVNYFMEPFTKNFD